MELLECGVFPRSCMTWHVDCWSIRIDSFQVENWLNLLKPQSWVRRNLESFKDMGKPASCWSWSNIAGEETLSSVALSLEQVTSVAGWRMTLDTKVFFVSPFVNAKTRLNSIEKTRHKGDKHIPQTHNPTWWGICQHAGHNRINSLLQSGVKSRHFTM